MAGADYAVVGTGRAAAGARARHRDAGGIPAVAEGAAGRREGCGRLCRRDLGGGTAEGWKHNRPGCYYPGFGQYPGRRHARYTPPGGGPGLRVRGVFHPQTLRGGAAATGDFATGPNNDGGRIRAASPPSGLVPGADDAAVRPVNLRGVAADVLAVVQRGRRLCVRLRG